MRSIKAILVRGVIFSLIPALFSFLGSTNVLEWAQKQQYVGAGIDVEFLKNAFSFLGISLTFVLLTSNLIMAEIKESIHRRQATELMKYTKEIMVAALTKSLGKEYCDINIRIFVPKRSIWLNLKNFFSKEKELYFCIKNIDGLAEAGVTNNLKFQVLPEADKQGLVGECFSFRRMVYDDNLIISNEKDYNLNDYQKNKTSDLRFIIVCPTFSEDGNIDSIVAFDSKNEIKVTNENQEALSNLILNYTQQLHEKVPELFKARGGIL
ncbi:hypothetical protein ABXS75_19765 [Roseburia hominis]